jgi:mannose-6-phosphate isomerase-like protein (cupin superfamily)
MTPIPQFPGSTAVSGLRVYDWEGADHHHGGSPHLHTVSSEAYYVTAGTGEVHTLSADGPERHILSAGDVLWFSPGTVHRLVNHDSLEIVTIMQNAGLPEAGDAVLTFPTEILRDPEQYAAAATLPDGAGREAAARARRDLALRGYTELRRRMDANGSAPLTEFYALAAALVRPKVERWTELWTRTVEAETERTRRQLASLANGSGAHLAEARVVKAIPRPQPRAFGMCGLLQIYDAPASNQSS